MPQVRLTREGLYDKIWSAPATHVAKEFHISDVALGKICRKMGVPKPPRGYWERLRAGKRVEPGLLPKPTDETQTTMWLFIPEVRQVDTEIQEMIDREDMPENRVTVADDLEALHPLLSRTRKLFDTAEPGSDGLITPPKDAGYPSIIASPDQSRRALLIMDALIRALETRGYSVVVSTDYWGESTRVKKDGEEIVISVYERSRRFKRELTTEERKKPPYLLNIPDQYRASGKLNIKVNSRFGSYERFSDRQQDSLEGRLNDVIAAIIVQLESLVAEKRRREEGERRRQEELRKREEERERREKLDDDAVAWQKSRRLHEYLDAYETRLLTDPVCTDADGTKAEWLRWARGYAVSLDPLERTFVDKTNDDEPQT